MLHSISYWADVGNIANKSANNLNFIDENEEISESFWDGLA